MKRSSRLILYIFLNIIISALTTLTVLWLWERAHPSPETLTHTASESAELSTPENTTDDQAVLTGDGADPFTENVQVTIRKVVGAGNLEAEYVEIYNQSDGAVNLTGWQLMDEEGQQFTFPALILNNEGAVEVHSKTGEYTVIELYWQADQPIWQSGEIVKLVDAGGEIMATYSIP